MFLFMKFISSPTIRKRKRQKYNVGTYIPIFSPGIDQLQLQDNKLCSEADTGTKKGELVNKQYRRAQKSGQGETHTSKIKYSNRSLCNVQRKTMFCKCKCLNYISMVFSYYAVVYTGPKSVSCW